MLKAEGDQESIYGARNSEYARLPVSGPGRSTHEDQNDVEKGVTNGHLEMIHTEFRSDPAAVGDPTDVDIDDVSSLSQHRIDAATPPTRDTMNLEMPCWLREENAGWLVWMVLICQGMFIVLIAFCTLF